MDRGGHSAAERPPHRRHRRQSGLGLETSIALAAAGAEVIMACRNPQRADPALALLRRRAPGANAELMPDVESGDCFGPDGWQQLKGHPRRVGCLRVARDPQRVARCGRPRNT